MHGFVKYVVNREAGTKLIFISVLIVILCTADVQTLALTGAALAISMASFFWRLLPLTRKMDRDDQVDPRNYSAVLDWMILAFVLAFLAASIRSLV
jgi:hypothetical protein